MTPARTLQRTIHVACRQLGLDEGARRAVQLTVTGKASLSDMTLAEMGAVLDRLKACGFKATGQKRPAAPRADLRYVHVLWGLLAKGGAVRVPGRAGLNAFVRTRFEDKWQSVPIDVDALRDAGQINDVTRALKDMCRRAGIPTEKGAP
jgi:phage gp16-like protein